MVRRYVIGSHLPQKMFTKNVSCALLSQIYSCNFHNEILISSLITTHLCTEYLLQYFCVFLGYLFQLQSAIIRSLHVAHFRVCAVMMFLSLHK
jgi:hypothetical protein